MCISALHPLTGQSIPVFAADYVVSEYGTEAVMGVPTHDNRDKLFADKFLLPSIMVNSSLENEGGVLLNSDKVHSLNMYMCWDRCKLCLSYSFQA